MTDYISIDLETTGFNPDTCEIIEIGAWKVKDGVVKDKFCTLVKPVMYIPSTVQNLTGITNEDVKDCDPISSVILELFDWCKDYACLGHNIMFDMKFLQHFGKLSGVDFSLGGQRQGIDTLELCRKYWNLSNNKLATVVKHLGININIPESFHRAGYDSYMTKLVYDRFLQEYPKMYDVNVAQVFQIGNQTYGEVVCDATLDFE